MFFWKIQDAIFATENAGLTGTTERKVFAGKPVKSGAAGRHFICGRNPVYPENKDRELCFFQAVRWDADFARTDAYQEDSVGSRLRSNTLWIFF